MEKEILHKIRMIRLERGYGQEYVAGEIGVSQSYYARLERGKAKLSAVRLAEILSVLGTDDFNFFQKENPIKLLTSQELD
ncbi:MAG: helix-turn-helix transcriptional regulator [Flavobacteriaceae bacterium]|jgi:transcriptional regulator with XRE-family HTH domain|nr:helix-turn-helix transcriptional regulator [Flavobacteriaceae bacterium]